MISKRQFLKFTAAGAMTVGLGINPVLANVKRLVFIHGRAQENRSPIMLKEAWLAALQRGGHANRLTLPTIVDVSFPYYGDELAKLSAESNVPLTSEPHPKGALDDDGFLEFQFQIADEIRKGANVSDEQVEAELGPQPTPKGPLNWGWVQAILRAVDKHAGGVSQQALELFTRDVFLYTTRAGVREEIDSIVAAALTEEPTVIVGHSLGSVVAYSVLRSDRRKLNIPLLVTVGCPLGIRPIRDQFRPLKSPSPVLTWKNAFDRRDVVALYPLDATNFPIVPAVSNFAGVKNHTKNRHGIDGYLDDTSVAQWILGELGA